MSPFSQGNGSKDGSMKVRFFFKHSVLKIQNDIGIFFFLTYVCLKRPHSKYRIVFFYY